jgi:hypothetical protein
MALVVKDRVQETTSTEGTGTLTLDGAVTGFQTFSSAIGNTNTTYYAISSDSSEFEIGIGTVGAGTLARTTILASSNGGNAVSLSAGTKNVFCTYPAGKSLYTDASGNAIALGTLASATLTNATGLPISTGVSGLGTNVAAFLATPSSANLASAITTSITGSGALVFDTSPSLSGSTLTNPTVTNYVESVVAIGTVGASSTISLTNGTVQTATLTSATACTFTMPTATAGKSFILLLKQPASGTPTTATFTGVKYGTAGAPTITATVGKMDILTFVADGTNWYGSYAQGYTP